MFFRSELLLNESAARGALLLLLFGSTFKEGSGAGAGAGKPVCVGIARLVVSCACAWKPTRLHTPTIISILFIVLSFKYVIELLHAQQ